MNRRIGITWSDGRRLAATLWERLLTRAYAGDWRAALVLLEFQRDMQELDSQRGGVDAGPA